MPSMPSSDFLLRSTVGLILDATALIDFCWLNEWEWLQQQYSPLFIAQEVLDSDRLEEATRETAMQYLEPLALDTEEMFLSFMEFPIKRVTYSMTTGCSANSAALFSISDRRPNDSRVSSNFGGDTVETISSRSSGSETGSRLTASQYNTVQLKIKKKECVGPVEARAPGSQRYLLGFVLRSTGPTTILN